MKVRVFKIMLAKGWARILYTVSLLVLPAILPAQEVTFTPVKSDVGAMRLMYGVPTPANSIPLIVVDGAIVPVDEREAMLVDFRQESLDSRRIGYLLKMDPNDIDSIRYLTDYKSTAIWGSRGSNGVVEVYTAKIQHTMVDSLLAGRTCMYGSPAAGSKPVSGIKVRWHRFKDKVIHFIGR